MGGGRGESYFDVYHVAPAVMLCRPPERVEGSGDGRDGEGLGAAVVREEFLLVVACGEGGLVGVGGEADEVGL